MTTKIKLLAWFHVVANGLALAAVLILCAMMLLSPDKESRAPTMILPPLFMLVIFILIPGLVGGIGLLQVRRWGRTVIVILSALFLLAIPVGTIIGALGLWVLLSRESDAAFSGAEAASSLSDAGHGMIQIPAANVAGLILTMAGVGAAFIVAIGIGFMIAGNAPPAEISSTFYPALGVLAFVLAYAVFRRGRGLPPPAMVTTESLRSSIDREHLARSRRAGEDERRQRLARLAADPLRRKYVPLIERGQPWSDAQIDYDLDPARTATCIHLRPVESAMRQAGIGVRLGVGQRVDAACRIDRVALMRDFRLGSFANYSEIPQFDRSFEDPPQAQIWCSACRSAIGVLHPDTAAAGTPVFPT